MKIDINLVILFIWTHRYKNGYLVNNYNKIHKNVILIII